MKEYICECGRVFSTASSFNGHKSHCETHLRKTGRWEHRLNVDKECAVKKKQTFKAKAEIKDAVEMNKWVSEQHTCERCGKVMTEKYKSGRFCSSKCAHSRIVTSEHISKLKKTWQNKKLSEGYISIRELNIIKYNESPNICCICSKPLDYSNRNRKTCSDECKKIYLSQVAKKAVAKNGGNNNITGSKGTAKYGTYKGYHCDSSYELAFLIYCLDHDIDIKRNTQGFPYVYKNNEHLYYPDFIVNGTFIEIKNYNNELVETKIKYFPSELSYKILYREDIKICIDYCKHTYGDFVYLYDKDYPSWMDRYIK